jgi:chromosome segregation ATPase
MPDLIDMSLAGPRALRAAVDFLGRLDEVEESVAESSAGVQGTLDELLERVRPIEAELAELRNAAGTLERRLGETERRVGEIDATAGRLEVGMGQLIEVAARLEGALEHVLDRVPGLSAQKAVRRGRALARSVAGGGEGA